ncbi:UNVERIFIED_CONTAM: protein NUCLEAR FUSION defective [Sesamum latifolium]|uniref:Protein NUCLEAR FUSION defective n=1 Tax=Sesamum latifolium TaxID=2727402 RepID=A0AAW2UNJ4_9LAMI
MTHASFSEENNKALSILGASVIETSVSLQSLIKDVDISAKDLNVKIADVSKVESSCNADGTRLGLQKIVRVSRKTNVTSPAVVCGAFRAIFGAIAVDAGSSDEAGWIYGKAHSGIGRAATM